MPTGPGVQGPSIVAPASSVPDPVHRMTTFPFSSAMESIRQEDREQCQHEPALSPDRSLLVAGSLHRAVGTQPDATTLHDVRGASQRDASPDEPNDREPEDLVARRRETEPEIELPIHAFTIRASSTFAPSIRMPLPLLPEIQLRPPASADPTRDPMARLM